jgi:hypothetical protein
MIKILPGLLVFLQIIFFSASGQSLPDSITIITNTYVGSFSGDSDTLYGTKRSSIIRKSDSYRYNGKSLSKSKVEALLSKLTNLTVLDNSLTRYGIDTAWIKKNPSEVLKLYSDKKRVEWNPQQREFIYKQLTNIKNYQDEFNRYLSSGCCYTMHQSYRHETEIGVYKNDKLINKIVSRKHVWGFVMPWTNLSERTIYDYGIEDDIKNITSINTKGKAPMKGDKLLKYLVNKIVDYNMPSLYKYSPYSYLKEIEELKADFEIISFEEVYGRGRYIWNDPKTMKVVLRNQMMLNSVTLNFFASKVGQTIYSRDSVKREYKSIVNRVQLIDFIKKYLEQNPNSKLDIYYFNDNGINDYNIQSVNQNPENWAKHDKYVEGLKWYEKSNVTPSFNLNEAIETSKRLYCGCNYRFDKTYIEKAIFFEIIDENKYSSIWFLLPDNKVLLYLMQGDKVLNFSYSEFGQLTGLQYPCVLFNNSGQRIEK